VRPYRGEVANRGPKGVIPNVGTKVARAVAAASEHKRYSADFGIGQTVVGHNNIGDVSFDWQAADNKRVIQNLWWRFEGLVSAFPLTRYVLPLANGST
jgi:hypothetical protein